MPRDAVTPRGAGTPRGAVMPRGAWTGGQWSVVRALLGIFIAVHCAGLVPRTAEIVASDPSSLFRFVPSPLWIANTAPVATSMALAGTAAGILIGIGLRDRIAALVAAWMLLAISARAPLTANASLPFVLLLLLVHAAMQRAPYGSLEARGRLDPGGSWRPNSGAWLALWIALAVGYAASGLFALTGPHRFDDSTIGRALEAWLVRPIEVRATFAWIPVTALIALTHVARAIELLFLPLAVWSRTRPWIWLALLAVHFVHLLLFEGMGHSLAMIVVHVATFDPAWVRSKAGAKELLFYDGSCGLCHRAVRFVLAEDTDGTRFTFAPLFGETFDAHIGAAQRASLPDSLIVKTTEGRILVRSDGALHILDRLGGLWRALAAIARVAPRPVRDTLYDGIARVRKRLFAAPKDVCPLLPPAFRGRFQA